MQKITPFLWFNDQAEEAVKFYTSIFKNSKIEMTTHYGEEGAKVAGMKKGQVMTIAFELEKQKFIALNGGPMFNFSQAISFVVNCENQKEIDWFWEKLGEGGEAQQCGWLKDKYGVPWQIVPATMGEIFSRADEEKSQKIWKELVQMKKIDMEKLESI